MSDLALIDEDERWMELERKELFRTSDPAQIKAAATLIANELAPMVKDRKLFKTISGRDHILVEGWTLLASMLGVSAVPVWTKELEDGQGYLARVEVYGRDGRLISAAEAMCTRGEKTWTNRDDHALLSMAQTRATSKALRIVLGFVFAIAGYETTPAEEMPPVVDAEPPRPRPAPDAATEGQTKYVFDLIAELEGYDPGTDWGAWCRDYAGGVPFNKLDRIGVDRVIAGLLEKVDELGPPTGPESSE